MMGNFADSGWWMLMGWAWMLGFWALIVWAVITLTRRRSDYRPGQEQSAMEILQRRYANGELSHEEFEEMSRRIRGR